MERHLSLIKTEHQELEKRVFPRFPFGLMVFKDQSNDKHALEVKDISLTGMQLAYRDGVHTYTKGDSVSGRLQWRNQAIEIKGVVQWTTIDSVGLSFNSSIHFEDSMRIFLSYENIVSHIKPLHNTELELEMPNDLKYWLKSDGVLEIFIWEHKTIGISRFQILVMEHFIEWCEGVGTKTGKMMTQRDLETPLGLEDEFIFQIDPNAVESKIEISLGILRKISEEHLPRSVSEFLIYKLGG